MISGNLLVAMLNTFYTVHCLKMLKKKNRIIYQMNNTELQKLRTKPIKTLEEQKRFLDIKYPKRPEIKIKKTRKQKHMMATHIVFSIVLYILTFNVFLYLLNLIGLNLKLWQGLIYAMVAPLIFNLILEKFKLQKSDLSVFFKF